MLNLLQCAYSLKPASCRQRVVVLPRRHRAALAAQQEEQRREQLAGRLAAKEAKVAAMEAEKAAMAHALEAVRKEITMQEHQLR